MLKPFVKWAGGKSQLLKNIKSVYPNELGKMIKRYCEPFIGGGAVLFDILENYQIEDIYISDMNMELVNTYRIIKEDVDSLILLLETIQTEYLALSSEDKKIFYYKMRERFNNEKINGNKLINVEKAGLFIFLNKTCFNGLYRVNSKGIYNVPSGAYKNPMICDKENLIRISKALKNVQIHCTDYRQSLSFIDDKTFVYIDPPYRPLNGTANFTSYTENQFDDTAQVELAKFVAHLNKIGAMVVISNSDPKNTNPNDNFFDELYKEFNIVRVSARRMINCNGESRGIVSEILVTNY